MICIFIKGEIEMIPKYHSPYLFIILPFVTLTGFSSFAMDENNIVKQITDNGLLKTIQEGIDIFDSNPLADGVQFKREKKWLIFFEEANRTHARITAVKSGGDLTDSYKYLVAFYRALADDAFRAAFEKEYPNISSFDAGTALDVSLTYAKRGLLQCRRPSEKLELLIEWYETLSAARNRLADINVDNKELDGEKSEFAGTVGNIAEDLISETEDGMAGAYANGLRSLCIGYGLSDVAKWVERRNGPSAFERSLHEALAAYVLGVADKANISVSDKLDALTEGAIGLLELRKISSVDLARNLEVPLIEAADRLWKEASSVERSGVEQMELDLKMILLKETIGLELWLGEMLPPCEEQEEPKPYKIALQMFRALYERALALLEGGGLSEDERNRAELAALEAQSWVSQLIQDMGIVFSHDFTFEEAAVERDGLLKIRKRVETNPAQTSARAWNLIQKARLHEIEFYQYQYKPEPLRKAVELITVYAPQVIPPLDRPIPAPEGRFDVRCGVGMLLWKAIALDHLQQYDEAEALFKVVIDLYGDRYRYPDPWCFSLVGLAKQCLKNIPDKRAALAAGKGGTE